MANAAVLLADGFEDIEAVSVIDVLRRGGVSVDVVSIGGSMDVESAHGLVVRATCLLEDVKEGLFDALILPGGGPGTARLRASEEVLEMIRRHHENGRIIAAICAAPLVLVDSGILTTEHVTCYPTCQMELDRAWRDAPVVHDGNIITSQSPGSAMLFSLVVLSVLCGEAIAHRTAREMVTDVLMS
jgi:4-methyl-5(b-hydroxyethyl)-thiazole monophosphate biosynthesis